jgi:hypothetical protein
MAYVVGDRRAKKKRAIARNNLAGKKLGKTVAVKTTERDAEKARLLKARRLKVKNPSTRLPKLK